ncbi:MAG: hypothetical protein KA392_07190 [Candidatus Obscuribacter sp.]|nr:hypothetical protein [Candidatus Obscuribacter sp.]MBP6592029.1 hypothetical protein [Candidatus Obscuribacter sp.]MBP7575423.1 hypothetical protein [Candidatus Obscuribacter sp.]
MTISTFKSIPFLGLFLLGLAIASRTLFEQIESLSRSQWHFSGVSLSILLGFCALSCVWLVWLCKSAAKRELAERQWSVVWTAIAESSTVAGVVCKSLTWGRRLIWLPVYAILLFVSFEEGIRSLGYTFLCCGNYVAAESIYRDARNPTHENYSFMCSTMVHSYEKGIEFALDRDKRIQALKRVYGANSSQLAFYYETLASSYLWSASRDKSYLYDESEKFACMSTQIYANNQDYESAASSMGIAAFSKANRGDLISANSLVAEALSILPGYTCSSTSKCSRLAELHYATLMVGDQSLINVLNSKCDCPDRLSVYKRKGFLDATTIAILIPIFLLLGLPIPKERTVLTRFFARRWRRQLALCASSAEQLKLLDNLTTLYLYDKKLDKADSYSKLMLKRSMELV